MSNTQPINLVVWIGPGRDRSPILQHTEIKTPSGDITLRANLGMYMMPADVPKTPGLHLVKADAHVFIKPGYGHGCSLIFRKARQIAGDLAELVMGAELYWDREGDPVADPHTYASDHVLAPGDVFDLFRSWHNGPRYFEVIETNTGIEVRTIEHAEFAKRRDNAKGAA
ncbi:hypothetical protein AB1K70_26535 [Bremerella sp. JC770]|uniref:hypothetical protein n=1 Tax=Bremerella sp. JC770 TaxID=3232137 RepID=UPI003457FC6B